MVDLPIDDARALVKAIADLASMARDALPASGSAMSAHLRDHLGVTDSLPNTSAVFDPIEHPNLQLALNEMSESVDLWHEYGLAADIGHYGGVSLVSLADGNWRGPTEGARQFVSAQVSATETLRCLQAGVVLTTFDQHNVAMMVYRVERHRPQLMLEVAASSQDVADRLLAHIQQATARLNVLRGKVLTFSYGEHGEFGLGFATMPQVSRSEVVLPGGMLEAIESHALVITRRAAELLERGQHIKRGLLLHGPPGTGKTHTISYLLGQMPDRTTIVLTGSSIMAIGQAGTLARKLAPATIVVEDVDLIGMDRGMPGGENNPLLFQLLNEMDGLQADDDVLFMLTTNRAEILEPALAARPGRVDQAIEIPLPDHQARRSLFELYLPGTVDDDQLDTLCERTEGVAAAFIKEAARRATLRTLEHDDDLATASLTATEQLLTASDPVLRRSLAAPDPKRRK